MNDYSTFTSNSQGESVNPEGLAQWHSFVNALFDPADIVLVRFIESWIDGTKKTRFVNTYHIQANKLLTEDYYQGCLKESSEQRANIFFGVCPRQDIANFDNACQIAIARALWADLDYCSPDEALSRCTNASLPLPSLAVNSGNGMHLYWLLDSPYLIDDCFKEALFTEKNEQGHKVYFTLDNNIKRYLDKPNISTKGENLQRIIAGIGQLLGGDHTHDASRILRLPGTFNRKDERNGAEPKACTLVKCDPDFRYSLDTFAPFALPVQVDELPRCAAPSGNLDELQPFISACKAEQGDRSAKDFALCKEAIKRNLNPEDVWEQVKDSSKFAERDYNYFNNTWQKAAKAVSTSYQPSDPFYNEIEAHNKKKLLEQAPKAKGYHFAPLNSAALAKARFTREWLVKNILVKGQPAIVGGPKKALKTSLLVALNLSLGSGQPFLDTFKVPKPLRSVLISGESGDFTIQETAFRIAKAMDIKLEDNLCGWDFRLPQLSRKDELAELSRGLKELEYKVAIIDPLYLCLLSGQGSEKNAANLFDMGPLLLEVAEACLSVDCTPILVHHAKKWRNDAYEPLELEELAFAGIQEFARQWLLLSRRAKYQPGTGLHELWLSVGGSAGQSGLHALDINEGCLNDDFTGRTWEVEVMDLDEAKEKASCKKQLKEEEKASRLEEEFLNALNAESESPAKSRLRKSLGWNAIKFDRVLGTLAERGVVAVATVPVIVGKGASREAEVIKLNNPQGQDYHRS